MNTQQTTQAPKGWSEIEGNPKSTRSTFLHISLPGTIRETKDGHIVIVEIPTSDEPIINFREWERQTGQLSAKEADDLLQKVSHHIAIELLRANITILPG